MEGRRVWEGIRIVIRTVGMTPIVLRLSFKSFRRTTQFRYIIWLCRIFPDIAGYCRILPDIDGD